MSVFVPVFSEVKEKPSLEGETHESKEVLRNLARYIAPMILFMGGAWLISLKIPFWSLFLGIPSVQIGIIFVIFSFDNSAKRTHQRQYRIDNFKAQNMLFGNENSQKKVKAPIAAGLGS